MKKRKGNCIYLHKSKLAFLKCLPIYSYNFVNNFPNSVKSSKRLTDIHYYLESTETVFWNNITKRVVLVSFWLDRGLTRCAHTFVTGLEKYFVWYAYNVNILSGQLELFVLETESDHWVKRQHQIPLLADFFLKRTTNSLELSLVRKTILVHVIKLNYLMLFKVLKNTSEQTLKWRAANTERKPNSQHVNI